MKSKARLPSPTGLMVEMAKVDRVRAMLGEVAETQLLLDTIEGETDAIEKLDLVVEVMMTDKTMSDQAYARGKRLAERHERARFIATQIMERFGVTKLERPLYTASISPGEPSVKISDEDRLPKHLLMPDKAAIKSALRKGEDVPGATLNNSPTVLRINIK